MCVAIAPVQPVRAARLVNAAPGRDDARCEAAPAEHAAAAAAAAAISAAAVATAFSAGKQHARREAAPAEHDGSGADAAAAVGAAAAAAAFIAGGAGAEGRVSTVRATAAALDCTRGGAEDLVQRAHAGSTPGHLEPAVLARHVRRHVVARRRSAQPALAHARGDRDGVRAVERCAVLDRRRARRRIGRQRRRTVRRRRRRLPFFVERRCGAERVWAGPACARRQPLGRGHPERRAGQHAAGRVGHQAAKQLAGAAGGAAARRRGRGRGRGVAVCAAVVAPVRHVVGEAQHGVALPRAVL
eukprot:318854-Chlamydomonas_euryale.AAC.1